MKYVVGFIASMVAILTIVVIVLLLGTSVMSFIEWRWVGINIKWSDVRAAIAGAMVVSILLGITD